MKLLPALFIALGCLHRPAEALVIRNEDPNRHDRFVPGTYPAAPTANPNFFASQFDFSGVGWNSADPRQSVTLVTPQHFVGANHFPTGVGTTLNFINRAGVLEQRTVTALFNTFNAMNQPTDLLFGALSAPLSSDVEFYPVLDLPAEALYVGRELITYGTPAQAGRGTINSFQDFGGDPITGGSGINSTRTYDFLYNKPAGTPDDAYAEVGDSGSPSFSPDDGRLALVGTHTAVLNTLLTVQTFDSFVPRYIDQMNGHLQQTSSPYRITTAPEPTSTLLVLLGAGCLLGRRKFRTGARSGQRS